MWEGEFLQLEGAHLGYFEGWPHTFHASILKIMTEKSFSNREEITLLLLKVSVVEPVCCFS